MDPSWVEAGAVFRWPDRDGLMRALVHDGAVVMYDAWWSHLGNWGLADPQKVKQGRVSYYVVHSSVLAEKATFVRSEPLTADERAVHRPDLPFAVAQSARLSWPAEVSQTPAWAAEFCATTGRLEGAGLQTPEVYLCPFGPKGGSKAGVRVRADNGTSFTAEELIRKAATIQAPNVGDAVPVHGVGIYRLGLQRGVPAFYLWGVESRML
ncbi:hypothetical protein [Micromonospora sp. NBC_00858]|uniref:hypothetical protein n=1 Tax=Micromonospora sp. NBC_00858 TaxID=2975979 RepID=UPI00386D5C74|nr:hypothetical protein OG990_16230 [Micromonospora sp. NBC_00858]